MTGTVFESVFDSLPDGIVLLDTEFTAVTMNDAAENMLELSRRKARGQGCGELLNEEAERLARKALAEERVVVGDEMAFHTAVGHVVYVQPSASPLYGEGGAVWGVVLQLRDLQAAKLLAAKDTQYADASTLEGLFLGIAHELKNPLSGIRGAAQLLARECDDDERSRYAETIVREADRLARLIDTLKGLEPFSRERFGRVDVNEILREIEYLESRSGESRGVRFELDMDITLPEIEADGDALKQAFLNVVKNAVQATATGGRVEIRTRWINDYKVDGQNAIEVEIRDNGKGMSREQLSDIFKPFYTTKEGGTGLGLFISYLAVARHGGAIMVDSFEGKGTTFHIYLPVPHRRRPEQEDDAGC